MKQWDDMSGQLMLTGAFILAILLVSIALILNNVIYFNNVSYMGFMDHSGNSDISIKSLVAQGAVKAYDESQGNRDAFNRIMQDMASSLNNVTLPEGIKVVIAPPYFFDTTYNENLAYPSTKFNLTIYTKDSIKVYSINTTHSPPPPTPTPGPTPLNCKVTITSPSDNQIVFQGGNNHTYITITVINLSNSLPVVNQPVCVNNNVSQAIGVLYVYENRTSMITGESTPVNTGNDGSVKLYWFPGGIEGTDLIYAKVGQTLSNNLMIINKKFSACNHIVTIDNYNEPTYNGNFIKIQIPINVLGPCSFSNFKVTSYLNSSVSSNVGSSDNGNFAVKGDVTGNLADPYIYIRYRWLDQSQQYTAVFNVTVSAYCNLDHLDYSNTRTFIITRP